MEFTKLDYLEFFLHIFICLVLMMISKHFIHGSYYWVEIIMLGVIFPDMPLLLYYLTKNDIFKKIKLFFHFLTFVLSTHLIVGLVFMIPGIAGITHIVVDFMFNIENDKYKKGFINRGVE